MRILSSLARRFAINYLPFYLSGLAMLVATNWIAIKIPSLSKSLIDWLDQGLDISDPERIAIAIIGLGFLQIIVRALSRILIFWPGRQVEAHIKGYYFRTFLNLPTLFFETHGIGDLISRLANDVGQIRVFFGFAILQLFNLIILITFVMTQMLFTHVGLTLASVAPLFLMIAVTKVGSPMLSKFSKAVQENQGKITNEVTDAFFNVQIVQTNAAEGAFIRRIERKNRMLFRSQMRLTFMRTALFPLSTLTLGISYFIVIFFGAKEVIKGHLSIGDILAFNIYIGLLAFPLTALGIIIAIYQRAQVAASRLNELDLYPEESAQKGSTQSTSKELISVRQLSFTYPGKNQAAIVCDKLTIQPGEKIGICGPIGSGKSTLFKLMTRIYDPPAGCIFYQGQDVLAYQPKTLRKKNLLHQPKCPPIFSYCQRKHCLW